MTAMRLVKVRVAAVKTLMTSVMRMRRRGARDTRWPGFVWHLSTSRSR